MFPDDTSVTTSEPADFDTVKLEEENSTNVSVKEFGNYSHTHGYYCHALIINYFVFLNHAVGELMAACLIV